MLQPLSSLCLVIAVMLSTVVSGWYINQTIDDLNPFILYQPPEKWHTYNDASCSGGTYTIGHDSCVNATIQCSWVSFYYSSPLWPYPISTEISIDGNEPTVVDLQDHSVPTDTTALSPSANSRVVFSYIGTQSLLHTILISGSAAYPYSIVDSLIFETVEGHGCGGGYGYHGGSTYSYSYNDIFTTTDTVTATITTITKIDAPLTEISTSISTQTVGTLTTTQAMTTTQFGATRSADTNILTASQHRSHGLKIGVAILAAAVGCLILCLCYFLWHLKRRAAHIQPGEKPGYELAGGGSGGGGGGNTGGDYGSASYGGGGADLAATAASAEYTSETQNASAGGERVVVEDGEKAGDNFGATYSARTAAGHTSESAVTETTSGGRGRGGEGGGLKVGGVFGTSDGGEALKLPVTAAGYTSDIRLKETVSRGAAGVGGGKARTDFGATYGGGLVDLPATATSTTTSTSTATATEYTSESAVTEAASGGIGRRVEGGGLKMGVDFGTSYGGALELPATASGYTSEIRATETASGGGADGGKAREGSEATATTSATSTLTTTEYMSESAVTETASRGGRGGEVGGLKLGDDFGTRHGGEARKPTATASGYASEIRATETASGGTVWEGFEAASTASTISTIEYTSESAVTGTAFGGRGRRGEGGGLNVGGDFGSSYGGAVELPAASAPGYTPGIRITEIASRKGGDSETPFIELPATARTASGYTSETRITETASGGREIVESGGKDGGYFGASYSGGALELPSTVSGYTSEIRVTETTSGKVGGAGGGKAQSGFAAEYGNGVFELSTQIARTATEYTSEIHIKETSSGGQAIGEGRGKAEGGFGASYSDVGVLELPANAAGYSSEIRVTETASRGGRIVVGGGMARGDFGVRYGGGLFELPATATSTSTSTTAGYMSELRVTESSFGGRGDGGGQDVGGNFGTSYGGGTFGLPPSASGYMSEVLVTESVSGGVRGGEGGGNAGAVFEGSHGSGVVGLLETANRYMSEMRVTDSASGGVRLLGGGLGGEIGRLAGGHFGANYGGGDFEMLSDTATSYVTELSVTESTSPDEE